MSAIDSDFDESDHGVEEEEDELVATRSAERRNSKEEDDEYSMDDDEKVGGDGNKEVKEEPVSAPAPENLVSELQCPTNDLKDAYIIRNNVAYVVPYYDHGMDETKPGRRRDYGEPIVVEDDDTLGNMSHPRQWPAPEQFSPKAIVVIKAKHNDDDILLDDKKKGPFGWYARVITKNDLTKPNSPNHKILKPIPKAVCKALMLFLSGHRHYMRSSLITYLQPDADNAKVFPVAPNEWVRCPGIKGTGVTPKKESKEPKEPKEPKSSNGESSSKGKGKVPPTPKEKPAEELSDDDAVIRNASSPSAARHTGAPVPAEKPNPRKGGILDSFKPLKQAAGSSKKPDVAHVEKPKAAEQKPKTPEDQPKASGEKIEASPEVVATNDESSSTSKRPLEGFGCIDGPISDNFKRVRYVDVDDKNTVATFWKGNRLFVLEP